MAKMLPMPTTDTTLSYALKKSLIATGKYPAAGDTFGSFIDACRQLGISDETPLAFIEFGVKQGGLGALERSDGEDVRGVGIREL